MGKEAMPAVRENPPDQDIYARIAGFASLGPDWDSYDAKPIDRACIRRASAFIRDVGRRYGEKGLPYWAAPVPDGGVHMEWREPGCELQLEFSPGNRMHYLMIDRPRTESEFFEEGEAETVEAALRLLAKVVASDG